MIRVIQRRKFSGRARFALTAGALAIAGAIQGPAYAAPPAPTAHVEDAGDGYLNADEVTAGVVLTGTYSTGVGVTDIIARLVNSATCDSGAPEATPTITIPVDGVTGTYSIGPFDISAFSEGAIVCGRARASDDGGATFGDLGTSDNLPVKDTVVASATLGVTDPINAANQTAFEATITAEAGATTKVFVSDTDGGTPTLFQQFTASGAAQIRTFDVTGLVDGLISTRVALEDVAGNRPADTIVTAPKDTVDPPAGTVVMLDPNTDGFMNATEAACIPSCIPANWETALVSDAVGATVWFEDSTAAIPGGCGPFDVGPTGFGAVNGTCAGNLPEGAFSFKGTWDDGASNVSDMAAASLVKDTLIGLTITQPTAGATVATQVELKGTTDAGSDVDVLEGLTPLGSTTAGTGAWGVNVIASAGPHTYTVVSTDPAGNSTSASVSVTVDPTIPILTTPPDGSIQPATVLVRGTAPVGEDVEILEGTTVLMSVTTDSTGNFQTHIAFGAGAHAITARLADPVSPPSFPRTFTVDENRPTVAIDSPSQLDILVPLSEPAVEGTAADGAGVASIRLEYYNAVTGALIDAYDATCACGGTSVTYTDSAPTTLPGLYRLVARAKDFGGNVSLAASVMYLV